MFYRRFQSRRQTKLTNTANCLTRRLARNSTEAGAKASSPCGDLVAFVEKMSQKDIQKRKTNTDIIKIQNLNMSKLELNQVNLSKPKPQGTRVWQYNNITPSSFRPMAAAQWPSPEVVDRLDVQTLKGTHRKHTAKQPKPIKPMTISSVATGF